MLKLIHTSDLQLDAPFDFLGENGAVYRQQLLKTFQKIAKLAGNGEYGMLLIAGDLFNDNRPSVVTVNSVAEILASTDVPVCILPGNHDCYDKTSIYRKARFPPNVHILVERATYLDFPDLDLTVAGNAILSPQGQSGSLVGVERKGDRRWFVVLAHGNLRIPGVAESKERPIEIREIEKCRADYVALGDWHAFRDCSSGNVKAFYSGSPEPTAPDQSDAGYIADVTLSDNGVNVQKIPVGTMQAERYDLDVTNLSDREVLDRIKTKARPNIVLDVRLSGIATIGQRLDPRELQDAALEGFFWLRVSDRSHLELREIDPDDYPEVHAIGKYVRMLSAKIKAAQSDREKTIAEQALQLGVALLQGKQVLK